MLSPAEIAREYETVIRAAKIMKSNQMVERRWEGLEKKSCSTENKFSVPQEHNKTNKYSIV